MARIQNAHDVVGHVDTIDAQPVDRSRKLDIDQPCIRDPHPREVDADELSASEVSLDESGRAMIIHGSGVSEAAQRCNRPIGLTTSRAWSSGCRWGGRSHAVGSTGCRVVVR